MCLKNDLLNIVSPSKTMKGVGLLCFAFLTSCIASTPDNQVESLSSIGSSSEAVSTSSASSGFGRNEWGDYGGVVTVRGYAETYERCLNWMESIGENCQKTEYIFFKIIEADQASMFDYIKAEQGNSFVADQAVGLGCSADGVISYWNAAGANPIVQHEIPTEETVRILRSSAEDMVTLRLKRNPPNDGMGAPACYSHFESIEVVN